MTLKIEKLLQSIEKAEKEDRIYTIAYLDKDIPLLSLISINPHEKEIFFIQIPLSAYHKHGNTIHCKDIAGDNWMFVVDEFYEDEDYKNKGGEIWIR